MIALVRSSQTCKLLSVSLPVEVTAVNNSTSYLSGMSVHVFRGGVRHDVASPFDRTAVDRCGEGVVHDEWYPMLVSHLRKALDVEHITSRVRDCLAEETLGVRAEFCFDACIIPVRVNESTFDTQLLQCHTKQVVCTPIDSVGCDEVIASLTDVEDCIEVSCLTATGQYATHTTFQRIDLGCHCIVRWVGQTGIEIARILQIEQTCHLLTRFVLECCTLINRQDTWLTLLRRPSCLYT